MAKKFSARSLFPCERACTIYLLHLLAPVFCAPFLCILRRTDTGHCSYSLYLSISALALGVAADGGAHSHAHRSGRQEEALESYGAQAGYEGGDLDGAASDAAADPLAMLQSSVPGTPGEDYPIYAEVPETAFLCDGQVDGGYYADPEAECQAFHICSADGQGGLAKYSFLCPNGTIFNQNYFICDWWFNFDCAEAETLFSKNDEIAAERAALDEAASNADASYAAPAADDAVASYAAPAADAAAEYDAPRAGRQRSGRAGVRRG